MYAKIFKYLNLNVEAKTTTNIWQGIIKHAKVL
jgi:hypothetical protein